MMDLKEDTFRWKHTFLAKPGKAFTICMSVIHTFSFFLLRGAFAFLFFIDVFFFGGVDFFLEEFLFLPLFLLGRLYLGSLASIKSHCSSVGP